MTRIVIRNDDTTVEKLGVNTELKIIIYNLSILAYRS